MPEHVIHIPVTDPATGMTKKPKNSMTTPGAWGKEKVGGENPKEREEGGEENRTKKRRLLV